LKDRLSSVRFGPPKSNGKGPDKEFIEMLSSVRLLGSIGIWPVSWFKLRSRISKLVKCLNPDGIAPVMLFLERERMVRLAK
jgi:hypothetical protein